MVAIPHSTPHSDVSRHAYVVAAADAGGRLDRFLAEHHIALSRQRLKTLILTGHVMAGGQTIEDPSYRVKPGQTVGLVVPPPVDATPQGQAIPLRVLHEDDQIIVIDKPAGLVVHPAPGNPDHTLVNALIAHCGNSLSGIGGVRRPGIVHRLDKDTSGVMVAAKNDRAHVALARDFAAHEIERVYLAMVWGTVASAGELSGRIGRDPRNRKRLAVVAEGGKSAQTHFRRVTPLGGRASLIECRLGTGRTHQIRVHLSHMGHSIVGDSLYGGGSRANIRAIEKEWGQLPIKRQALHAAILGLNHPVTGKVLKFETELPRDIVTLGDYLQRMP